MGKRTDKQEILEEERGKTQRRQKKEFRGTESLEMPPGCFEPAVETTLN